MKVQLSFWQRWRMTSSFMLGMLLPIPLVIVSGAVTWYWVIGLLCMLAAVVLIERFYILPKRVVWEQRMAELWAAVLKMEGKP